MAKLQSIILRLVRCGETTWSDDGRLVGSSDLPLSDAGRAAVRADAARLDRGEVATIYHPADEAAIETAQIIGRALGAKPKVAPELADPHLGLLEGLTEQQFAERFPKRYKQWLEDPLSVSPPEAPDVMASRDQLFAAVAKLLRRSRRGEVAMVMQTQGMGLLQCWLAQRPAREMWAFVKSRPRIERYALTSAMINQLEEPSLAGASKG